MRHVTRLSISQQKGQYKNKNEVARKPGRPKKQDETDDSSKDTRPSGYSQPIESCKEIQGQVAPMWRLECDIASHQGTHTDEA
jgi:hypothetical protein